MDPVEKLRAIRAGLGGVVELLVAMLDDLDGDENLEDADEDTQVDDDRCDVADSGDYEPSLGRLETIHQGSGSYGDDSDREVCILSEPHDSEEGQL